MSFAPSLERGIVGPRPLLLVTSETSQFQRDRQNTLVRRVGGPLEFVKPHFLPQTNSTTRRILETRVVDLAEQFDNPVSVVAIGEEAADATIFAKALSRSSMDRVVIAGANIGNAGPWREDWSDDMYGEILVVNPKSGVDGLPGPQVRGVIHLNFDRHGGVDSHQQAVNEVFNSGGGHKNLLAVTAHINHLPLPE